MTRHPFTDEQIAAVMSETLGGRRLYRTVDAAVDVLIDRWEAEQDARAAADDARYDARDDQRLAAYYDMADNCRED